jgi:S1-C subfamily serine protease
MKIAEQVKVGEICLALGYPRNHDEANDHLPRSRLGLVTQAYKDQWFETSYQSDFNGHPVFNMDGELLGLQANSDGTYSTHSCGRPIQDHWKALTSGMNMDRKRLFEDIRPPQDFEELPATLSDEGLAKAKTATVQIGEVGKKPVFSGVLVPDGYVITCAHHRHLPGDRLEITLADGRSANVVVRGTNRRTDTCLLKITDTGEWPFVNLGYSSLLPPGKSAVVIGYPIKNNQRPLVLDLIVIETPKGGLKRRDSLSDKIFLQCDDEEVVTNLKGASGGGVFDTAGNLVGVISSTSSEKSHDGIFSGEIDNARVELFHKNWASLASDSSVEVVDKEVQKNTLQGLTKLMSELKVSR